MKKNRRTYRWWGDVLRPHEALATQALMTLFGDAGRVVCQEAFGGSERRVDLTVDGDAALYALPPYLADRARGRRLLIELESGALSVVRCRLMVGALWNAYMQNVRNKRVHPPPPDPSAFPMLVVYARSVSRTLRLYLEPTPDAGVFGMRLLDLNVYIVDNSKVPSDSSYAHLKLLHAPRARDKEEFQGNLIDRVHAIRKHARIPRPLLQRLIMTAFHQLIPDDADRGNIYEISVFDAYDEGHETGLGEGALQNARTMLERLMEARNLRLDSASETHFHECEDVGRFQDWLTWLIDQPEGTTVTLP